MAWLLSRRRSTRRSLPPPPRESHSTEEETNMIKPAICAALAVALVTSGAASVQAQAPGDKPISGITLESSMPIVATVVGIDPNGETVTLVLPGGTTTTQKVGNSVQNLRRLRIGEVVTVT